MIDTFQTFCSAVDLLIKFFLLGYGFVDFELAQTAEIAVTTLKNQGIQVQMARVKDFIIIT